MPYDSDNCRKSDRLVFIILLCAVMIEGGRMLISTSNIGYLQKIEARGQEIPATVVELKPHKYSHKTSVFARYTVDKQDFLNLFIVDQSNPEDSYSSGDEIILHFLAEKPAKAVFLEKASTSMLKFNGGWTLIFIALLLICKYVYSTIYNPQNGSATSA